MVKGKSTWRYNKLLTARRNYFLGGGGMPTLPSGFSSPDELYAHYDEYGFPEGDNQAFDVYKNWYDMYGQHKYSGATANPLDTTLPDSPYQVNASAQLGQLPGNEPTVKAPTNPDTDTGTGKSGTGLVAGIASIASQATSDVLKAVNTVKGVKENAKSLINNVKNSMMQNQPVADSYDAIQQRLKQYTDRAYITTSALFGKNKGDMAMDAFASAARGGAAGASLGPWGAAGAAAGGLVSSLIGNSLAKKAAHKWKTRVNDAITEANAYNDRLIANMTNNVMGSEHSLFGRQVYSLGGNIMTHGADFTNGLMSIDNGGSHGTNPNEGVPMGVDPEGNPNLVEEGETIFNDYVFSKRLMVPNAIRSKYKLGKVKDISFADASKKLAKESEERPNDPISKRGLQALMLDLAMTQESMKNNGMGLEFAYGGNLYPTGGSLKYQTVISPDDPLYSTYKDYLNDDYTVDFDRLYADDSVWMIKRNQISKLLEDKEKSRKFREWYAQELNKYNKDRDGYKDYRADDITKELFDRWSSDRMLGYGHNVIGYKDVDKFLSPRKTGERRWLLGAETDANGTPLDAYATAAAIDDYDPDNKTYQYVSKKTKTEGDTDYTDYYYRKLPEAEVKKAKEQNVFYYRDKPDGEYIAYEGDTPSLYMMNNGYLATTNSKNNTGGTDYFYDKKQEFNLGKYAPWLRYAPVVGLGMGALTDLFGITNNPDYRNADAVLEATRENGTYQPVRYNPVHDDLTLRLFDRAYYLNQLSAQANASRRALEQSAGMNRGIAQAGILAADNNTMNQIGTLGRQAEEYNWDNRMKYEGFERDTRKLNSEGMFQADTANQKALAERGKFNLEGTLLAAQMKDTERQRTDASKSSNISGFFQSLADIGFEEYNARMRDWAISHGIYGPGTWDYGRFKKKEANGGKIKRKKKGLTF